MSCEPSHPAVHKRLVVRHVSQREAQEIPVEINNRKGSKSDEDSSCSASYVKIDWNAPPRNARTLAQFGANLGEVTISRSER